MMIFFFIFYIVMAFAIFCILVGNRDLFDKEKMDEDFNGVMKLLAIIFWPIFILLIAFFGFLNIIEDMEKWFEDFNKYRKHLRAFEKQYNEK